MSKSWPRDSNHNASGKPGAVHSPGSKRFFHVEWLVQRDFFSLMIHKCDGGQFRRAQRGQPMCGFMIDHVDMSKLNQKQKDNLKKQLARRKDAVEKQIDAHN